MGFSRLSMRLNGKRSDQWLGLQFRLALLSIVAGGKRSEHTQLSLIFHSSWKESINRAVPRWHKMGQRF
jgi:hypothetical protein